MIVQRILSSDGGVPSFLQEQLNIIVQERCCNSNCFCELAESAIVTSRQQRFLLETKIGSVFMMSYFSEGILENQYVAAISKLWERMKQCHSSQSCNTVMSFFEDSLLRGNKHEASFDSPDAYLKYSIALLNVGVIGLSKKCNQANVLTWMCGRTASLADRVLDEESTEDYSLELSLLLIAISRLMSGIFAVMFVVLTVSNLNPCA